MFGALRAAAVAVAAVVGRRSRMMLGRPEAAMSWPDWNFGRCAMVRIETMAVSSDAMIGDVEGAFESHAEAAVPRVAVADIAVVGLEFEVDIAG
jgi:hypothetical protein